MKQKIVITSLIYKFIERLGVKGLGLIISVVLARLLSPEDFGQIAILTVFINISQVIVESGLTTALIQRKDVTDQDYSTVFFVNMALAVVCFIALQCLAPLISVYYQSNITVHLRIYAWVLFFGAFNALQLARMQKKMHFRQMMMCSLIATIISGAAGIAAAYMDLGLWALIIYYMMNSLVTCITFVFAERWLPKFEFSLQRAKLLFGYGWKMLVSAILCSLYNDARSLIIGKKYTNEDLGYYTRGQQFPAVISNTLDSAIQSVMFPTMASVQDEKAQVRRILRKAVTTGVYLIVPIMFGLAAVAESVVRLLLTEKWLPCVVYMQWICLGEAAVPIISSNLIAIKASGRSDIYMRLELVRRIVMLTILMISVFVFDSVQAIAVSFALCYWLDAFVVSVPVKKLLDYGFVQQMADIWKSILAAAVMFVVVFSMHWLKWPVFVLLLSQIIVGVVVYLLICFCIKVETQADLIRLVGNMIHKNK